MLQDGWAALSTAEKYSARMLAWQEPEGVAFASPEAAAAYAERAGMIRDALELRNPVRVPISPWAGLFPARSAGMTAREAYYDASRLAQALIDYHATYRPDTQASFMTFVPGKVLDLLDYRMYDWPGHGTADDSGYQYNEAEYMREDEYTLLVTDPSAFWQTRHLPRMFGGLEPMRGLPPLTDLGEIPSVAPFLMKLASPEVQDMLTRIVAAGEAARDWFVALSRAARATAATVGIPGLSGGTAKAPDDVLGETMRTRGVMLDTFRRRDDLLAATDGGADHRPTTRPSRRRCLDEPVHRHAAAQGGGRVPVGQGLRGAVLAHAQGGHRGPDRRGPRPRVVRGGLVQRSPGRDRRRRDRDGRTIWLFNATDMTAVRDRFRGFGCFGGNVPGALLSIGTPAEVDDHVRRLLFDVAGDGGFILSTGVVADDARPENFAALMEAGRA